MKINWQISVLVLLALLLPVIVLATPATQQTVEHPQATLTIQEQATGENAEHQAGGLGAELPLWSALPFLGILLSIAIFPLLAPRFWHHHYGKVSLFWALIFAIPFLVAYRGEAIHEILHIYLKDYIPFIILLWSLFTVAGGIYVRGAPLGSPFSNLLLLLIGTFLASWIGTTGASMVLIRPLLRMNKYRKNKVHLVVFFIFLVSNIGGALTPLGDPPLFLGFLHGVPFFWTFRLIKEMGLLSGMLLALFFLFDLYLFRKEGWHERIHEVEPHIDFEFEEAETELVLEEEVEVENNNNHLVRTKTLKTEVLGLVNIIFLFGIIAGVLFSGLVHLGTVNVLGVQMEIESMIRDAFLVLMGLLSLRFTPWKYREGNEFTWFPIVEVAKLFAGIFMTIIPALAMLHAGVYGNLKFIIQNVKEPWHYFWITGGLSSFLDNAPTYLTFLNTALGQFYPALSNHVAVHELIANHHIYLAAISTGAVFFGANTYIGNAPNFMVRSIAEEQGVKMPSFFGYMVYSIGILLPLFGVITLIFFL